MTRSLFDTGSGLNGNGMTAMIVLAYVLVRWSFWLFPSTHDSLRHWVTTLGLTSQLQQVIPFNFIHITLTVFNFLSASHCYNCVYVTVVREGELCVTIISGQHTLEGLTYMENFCLKAMILKVHMAHGPLVSQDCSQPHTKTQIFLLFFRENDE